MFTGLIEEVGRVLRVAARGGEQVLAIQGEGTSERLTLGDSIAVNGVCLTVDHLIPGGFMARVMPETARKTTLGSLGPGDAVNLERALRASSRMGGHFVLGHVDAVAPVLSVRKEGQSVLVAVKTPIATRPYLVPAGSVALEGVSLTLARVSPRAFTVSLVRHTLSNTTLGKLRPGSRINVEADILGKYVGAMSGGDAGDQRKGVMDRAFMRDHGWPL